MLFEANSGDKQYFTAITLSATKKNVQKFRSSKITFVVQCRFRYYWSRANPRLQMPVLYVPAAAAQKLCQEAEKGDRGGGVRWGGGELHFKRNTRRVLAETISVRVLKCLCEKNCF
jgi:hypothetical protein